MGYGIEFANGTTDACKNLVARLFKPTELFGAYRMGRQQHLTSDLVLVTSEADPSGFECWPRTEYTAKILGNMNAAAASAMRAGLTMAHKSAHEVMQVPWEDNAWWLVILRREAIPVMVLMHASEHETETVLQ